MKLNEIFKSTTIDSVNVKLINGLLDKKKHIAGDIYLINDSDNEIYTIILNNEMVTYLYTTPFSNDIIKNGYVSKEIWVHNKHQYKGHVTTLYEYIIDNGGTIISDSEQTSAGIALWSKLSKIGTTMIYDTDSGKIHKRSDISDIDLYVNDRKNNHYRLYYLGSLLSMPVSFAEG